MNKIIAICAAQIYLWEQERQIHAICDCARERGYEVMIYNLSVKMDVETSHSRGELSVFSVIPYDQLAALVVLGDMDSTDTVPFNISHEKSSMGSLATRKLPARWVSWAKFTT